MAQLQQRRGVHLAVLATMVLFEVFGAAAVRANISHGGAGFGRDTAFLPG